MSDIGSLGRTSLHSCRLLCRINLHRALWQLQSSTCMACCPNRSLAASSQMCARLSGGLTAGRKEPGNAAMPVSTCQMPCCNHSNIPGHCNCSLSHIMPWSLPANSRLALICREPDAPHQLHFDMDEAQLRKGPQHYQLGHPVRPAAISRPPSISWAGHVNLPHALLTF